MVSATWILAMLSLNLGIPTHPAAQTGDIMFPDVPKSHWAYEAIAALKRDGILLGYPNGTFDNPTAPAKSKPKFVPVETTAYSAISRNSWVFKDLRFLEDQQIFVFPPPYFPTRTRNYTRYEVAIAVKRSLDAITVPHEKREPKRDYTPEAVMRLKRLLTELSPEVKSIGGDPEKMQHALDFVVMAPN